MAETEPGVSVAPGHEAFEPARATALPASFFVRATDVVARELLGQVLVSRSGGQLVAGVIVETEAYLGAHDPGSHAATKGVTARNRVMYGPPGCAYVYFTYGSHHMLNLVTEAEGTAGAVLVRAIEPIVGVGSISARRGGRSGPDATNGPGKVTAALGINLSHNATALGEDLAVYAAPRIPDDRVATSGRVGLTDGHDLPLRFLISGNRYVSKGRTGPKPKKRCLSPRTKESA